MLKSARSSRIVTTTGVFVLGIALVGACAKKDETPPPTTVPGQQPYPANGYPSNGYPANGSPQGTYPNTAPTGYATAAPTGYGTQPPPQQGGAPPAATGPTGQMATPNALALPCQNDSSCGLARCNVQFSKCAFPCQSPVDCAQGASCNTVTGLCLPFAQ